MRMPKAKSADARPVLAYQLLLLVALFVLWWALVTLGILPRFFFGDPVGVLQRLFRWFATGTIFPHLLNTLIETMLSFVLGTVSGLLVGLWLALSPLMARILDPFIKAATRCRG